MNADLSNALAPTCVRDGTWTLAEFARAARIAVREARRSAVPVVVVPGDAAPRVRGEGFFWTTLAGDRIRRPSAYKARGFRTIYVPSTRRVEVGAAWDPRGPLPDLRFDGETLAPAVP